MNDRYIYTYNSGENFKNDCLDRLERMIYGVRKNMGQMDFENAVQKRAMETIIEEAVREINKVKDRIENSWFYHVD